MTFDPIHLFANYASFQSKHVLNMFAIVSSLTNGLNSLKNLLALDLISESYFSYSVLFTF